MTGPTRRSGSRDPGDRNGRSVDRGPGDLDDRLRSGDPDSPAKPRGMERLSDLLPQTARQLGLDDQLEQARAAAAWLEVVAARVPAAASACRLIDLRGGVATIETDEPIVAQEIRLRSPELLAALRARTRMPVRQLRVATRHV